MYCPKCGHEVNLKTNNELVVCSCTFIRPLAWWNVLELDINTEIDWIKKEEKLEPLPTLPSDVEDLPEDWNEYCESPWND